MINESFIYSVSQLNSKVRFFLEENFFLIRVEGEISNFSKPTSSHMYFSLKDTSSQIRCSMFHNRNKDLTFSPKNGMHVLVEALVSLYEKRGDYQLIVQSMEFKGDGLLREKFEKLKQKLFSSGLFDEKHKKKIPLFPKCVGIISSPTGAAVKDVITIIKRRSFNIDMIIYPTQTQGDKAQHQIVEAIDLANKRRECDVLILTRGGGTLEDIWSFNEESVANSVFNSSLPIVSAVGHEIDFTITDFVADLRASTPSAAAELVSAKSYELKQIIEDSKTKLVNLINNKLQLAKFSLSNLLLRLGHPKKQIENYNQKLLNSKQKLISTIENILQNKKSKLMKLSSILESLSPLAVLNRGYSIVTKNNKIIRTVRKIKEKELLDIQLSDGLIKCEVKDIKIVK